MGWQVIPGGCFILTRGRMVKISAMWWWSSLLVGLAVTVVLHFHIGRYNLRCMVGTGGGWSRSFAVE